MNDIKIENLIFSYDEQIVLQDINLTYDIKDFLVIIGPNGGGKTTLLKLMLGLLKPSAGEIRIFDKFPKDITKDIGYVPQTFLMNLNFPMRVIDVVLMGVINKKIFGFYTKEQKNLAIKALEKVSMDKFSFTKIGDLSVGQRQRVYIARALCAKAKILMLDEPTASIDTKGQTDIYELLKDINSNGIGVILISHDLNLALSYASKVAYVSKNLYLHDIPLGFSKQDFISHLTKNHQHFCDVELALNSCGCDFHTKEG